MAPGSVSPPAGASILLSTAGTMWTTACQLASRCVAMPVEEPSGTVCEATASTATTDEDMKPTDDEECLDKDNYEFIDNYV